MAAPVILVVEDEPAVAQLLEQALAFDGYCTVTAGSAEEAITLVDTARPDLIILDLILPGMSGSALIQQLRADDETRALPVVAVTAQGHIPTVVRMRANTVIEKPFDLDYLLGVVAALLSTAPLKERAVRG